MISSNEPGLGCALITQDVLDATQLGIGMVGDTMNDPGISAHSMETLLMAKSCFLTIRKSMYIYADFICRTDNYGYYNINDFMRKVCDNLRSYLSGIFDVEIVFEENWEMDLNLCFNGRILEMSIYDIAYNMLQSKAERKRITFYVKNREKHIGFGARSNYSVAEKKKSLTHVGILFPDLKNALDGKTYASVAADKMDGYVRCRYLKNMTRTEIFIPKTLKISSHSMKEAETEIKNGEAVMVHEVFPRGRLRDFFADIEFEFGR